MCVRERVVEDDDNMLQNTVDILVGWHIDTCQDDELIQFISGTTDYYC